MWGLRYSICSFICSVLQIIVLVSLNLSSFCPVTLVILLSVHLLITPLVSSNKPFFHLVCDFCSLYCIFIDLRLLGLVSQKVVNRKIGRTPVFTIYDRFTKFTDFRYTTFFSRKLPTGSEQS